MGFAFFTSPQTGEFPVLFLPGWGFDSRIITLYDLKPLRDIILPDSFLDPATLQADLLSWLDQQRCGPVCIYGWSMGAQLGLDFSLAYPERVKELTLFAMRTRWPKEEIKAIRDGICADTQEYMRGFYRKCFLGYKKAYQKFVSELQDDYLANLDRDLLLTGLAYLENFTLPDRTPEGYVGAGYRRGEAQVGHEAHRTRAPAHGS